MREAETARYIRTLCTELVQCKDYLEGASVSTVYFGGGTPSRLPAEQIGLVKDCIDSTFGLESLKEFTVECNPDDVNGQYVSALRSLGVNRISMGIQTFNDDMLRFLGRRHTASQALDAVHICRDSGISDISIDLMYGLPGQTLDMFRTDLETALAAGVQHISSYCLSYEENTPLQALREQEKLIPASDELCACMFSLMCGILREGGFEHYEISNFSKPGCRSRHNSSYWDGTPYLGVGAAAHSYNGKTRRWNPSDLDTYMDGIEQSTLMYEEEQLSATDLYNERIMLSLRTSQGLNLSVLSTSDRLSVLKSAKSFIDRGQIIFQDPFLRLSESSFFVSDSIISSLFK